MGLGPPVCTECMRVLDYDENRIKDFNKNPWYCSVHGDYSNGWCTDSTGKKTNISSVFCFPKEQADIIEENTRKYREENESKK